MTLSQLDLDLMEYSDKTLKVGTLLERNLRIFDIDKYSEDKYSRYWAISYDTSEQERYYETELNGIGIYGSPFGWGRVCMLWRGHVASNKLDTGLKATELWCNLNDTFNKNPELYDMDCLSWDEETKKLVLDFLNSLFIKK